MRVIVPAEKLVEAMDIAAVLLSMCAALTAVRSGVAAQPTRHDAGVEGDEGAEHATSADRAATVRA